jgi:hypothetical protein
MRRNTKSQAPSSKEKSKSPIITIRFALIGVGTAAYFSLAGLGWGGLGAFFSHPALIANSPVAFLIVLPLIASAQTRPAADFQITKITSNYVIVHADEKLTAFLELENLTRESLRFSNTE